MKRCREYIHIILTIIFFTKIVGITAQPEGKSREAHPGFSSKEVIRSEWFAGARSSRDGSLKAYTRALQEHLRQHTTREVPENYGYAQWQPLGPSRTIHPVTAQLGLVSSLWIDTTDFKTLYAGSNTGGIFVTGDGGENWRPLSSNTFTTGVLSIHVDPSNHDRIIIGTGHYGFNRSYGMGVMISEDAGETWRETALNNSIMSPSFIVQKTGMHPVSPDTLLALVNVEFRSRGLIYRTTDGTDTWEPVFSKPKAELFQLVYKPGEPNTVYACGNLLLESNDAGATWTDRTQVITIDTNFTISRLALSISAQDPSLMLAFCETYDTTGQIGGTRKYLYRSTDGGESFQKLGIQVDPFSGYWKMQLAISYADNNEFYLGGVWLFKYRIEDDSARYIECSDHKYHVDVRDLHVFATGGQDLLYMGNDGGVSRSETGAESWTDITRNGMQILQLHNITTGENSDMMFGGPQDANLSFYNFKTREWTKNARVSDAYDGAIDHQNPNNVYLVGVPPKMNQPHLFLKKSVDGGITFEIKGISDSTEIGRYDKPLEMDPTDPQILYLGVRNVWKSTDGAETFTRISNFPGEGAPKLITIRVAPSNTNVIYAAFENPDWGEPDKPKLFVTPDGGDRWFDITPNGNLNLNYAGVTDVAIHPENPGRIWLSLDRLWLNRKVYMSNDGGTTWTNFSEGLPNLPVNTIKYVKGAGMDVLLAATDAGVYYRDESLSQWVPFGTGLPLTIVADLTISYSRKKIIAGTFGRGLWEADLCLPLREESLVVNQTEDWSTDRKVLQDLVLERGAELTIRGKVEMGRGRSITILPGATLNLEGGTLTNECAGMWEGVRLYGSPDFNDTETGQGRLNIRYGGTISNAITGVECLGSDAGGNHIPGTGGGIITALNARFTNNYRAVVFNTTQGINPSSFVLTRFQIQNIYPGKVDAADFVTLDRVQGIRFRSCQFENTIPNSQLSHSSRGTGIKSYNSSFAIGRYNTDSIPFGVNAEPAFRMLSRGIEAVNSLPGFSISVSNVKFDKNLTGMYVSGAGFVSVEKSTFALLSGNFETDRPVSAGIYLDRCKLFQLNRNLFTGMTGSVMPKSKSAGIVIHESGTLNNLIAGNGFNNVNYGIIAQNCNRNEEGTQGLRVLYNWFSGNEYDVCATLSRFDSRSGLARHQGSSGTGIADAAGNRFSYSRWHRDGDIHNAGNRIYYHYVLSPEATQRAPRPGSYGIHRIPNTTAVMGDSTALPAFMHDFELDATEALNNWTGYETNYKAEFESRKDGGNSEELIQEIENHSGLDAPGFYKRLYQISPFLSDESLLSLTGNDNFPGNLLVEILKRNPHFLRIPGIFGLLQAREPELRDYLYISLAEVYGQFSDYERLESVMDYARAGRDAVFAGIAGEFAGGVYPEGLRLHMLSDDRPDSRLVAAALSQGMGRTAEAAETAYAVAQEFPDYAETKVLPFLELLRINEGCCLPGLPAGQLTEADSLLLELMSQGDCRDAGAGNLLDYLSGSPVFEVYLFPGQSVEDTLPQMPVVNIEGRGLRVYPVPASDFVIIDYFAADAGAGCTLQVLSPDGRLCMELSMEHPWNQMLVNTSKLSAGVYMFVLQVNGKSTARQKVIIAR